LRTAGLFLSTTLAVIAAAAAAYIAVGGPHFELTHSLMLAAGACRGAEGQWMMGEALLVSPVRKAVCTHGAQQRWPLNN
jgi:hypothetical protein